MYTAEAVVVFDTVQVWLISPSELLYTEHRDPLLYASKSKVVVPSNSILIVDWFGMGLVVENWMAIYYWYYWNSNLGDTEFILITPVNEIKVSVSTLNAPRPFCLSLHVYTVL